MFFLYHSFLSSCLLLFSTFINYCKEKEITVHQNCENSGIRLTDEQQEVRQIYTEHHPYKIYLPIFLNESAIEKTGTR